MIYFLLPRLKKMLYLHFRYKFDLKAYIAQLLKEKYPLSN